MVIETAGVAAKGQNEGVARIHSACHTIANVASPRSATPYADVGGVGLSAVTSRATRARTFTTAQWHTEPANPRRIGAGYGPIVVNPEADVPRRRAISSAALGIGLASGAYALSFGAIAVASGLDVWQTQVLSILMFTGASQFALVGVLGAGGGAVAAVLTAWLLGARNGIYALSMAPVIRVHGVRRLIGAQLTIDESTAMALANPEPPEAARMAFWRTGISIFVLWNIGTLLGALGAAAIGDAATLGLDAAIPAAFVALLWPRLVNRSMWALALAAGAVAIVLTPFLRPGLPVLVAGLVALVAAALIRDPS